MRRSSRRSARSTAATSTATSSSPARWCSGTARIAVTALPRTSTVCSRRPRQGGACPCGGTVAAARELGNPYWIAYALWIAGLAFSKANAQRALAAWDEGVEFVREHRVQFFEGFLARDAARLHTSDGEPEAALGSVLPCHQRFSPSRQRPPARHHPGERAGTVRAGRPPEPAATLLAAMSREQSSTTTSRTRRARGTAEPAARHQTGSGSDGCRRRHGPRRRRVYARRQIDRARRDPRSSTSARPGGLSRREMEVLRLVADGRTARRDRDPVVHLGPYRRAPHSARLHKDRRQRAAPRQPVGPSRTRLSRLTNRCVRAAG